MYVKHTVHVWRLMYTYQGWDVWHHVCPCTYVWINFLRLFLLILNVHWCCQTMCRYRYTYVTLRCHKFGVTVRSACDYVKTAKCRWLYNLCVTDILLCWMYWLCIVLQCKWKYFIATDYGPEYVGLRLNTKNLNEIVVSVIYLNCARTPICVRTLVTSRE